MRPALAVLWRDLRKYLRSPAQIMVSLFLPLLQLLIIGYAFGGKIENVSVALVDLDRGPEAQRVRQRFQAIEANANTFRVRMEASVDEALKATRNGFVAATIVIPENYSSRVQQDNRPKLGLVLDNTDPFVVGTLSATMAELVQDLNEPAVPPRHPGIVDLKLVEIFPYIEYIQYLLPGSITLAVFVCALIGGGLLYVDDKARGFHEGYLVTPITKLQLVVGMVGSGTIKATIAGTVVTILGSLIAGLKANLTPGTLLLLFAFNAIVAFALITMITLFMVRVSDPVVPRAMFGILNILLFFPSGAMYPIYGFPDWLKLISAVDPFSYAVHGFRSVLLKNVGWEAIASDVTFLVLFSAACFCGVVALFPRRL